MNRLLSGFAMFLLSTPLFAAMMDEGAASAPAETVSLVWVALFAVIFFGMIAFFFWYLWYCEKNRTSEE